MSRRLYNRRRLLAVALADAVFGTLPRRVSYVLMAVVGWLVATVLPRNVAGLRSNLEHVFPDYTPAQVTDLMQRNAKNYGKFWVDLFKMPHLPMATKLRLASKEGEEHLEEVMRRGKGAVVVTIHMGGWEGCASLWGSTSKYRSGLIMEVLEPPALWRRVVAMRESSGLSIIPLTRTAPRDILRRLKNNEIVAGAIDRDILGTGKPYPFFGGEISVPTGLVDVAQRTGAGLLPVICLRNGDDTYKFVGTPPIWVGPGEGATDAAVREVLARFEGFIRQYPDQWHVMVPIFKPRPDRVGVPASPTMIPVGELEERVG